MLMSGERDEDQSQGRQDNAAQPVGSDKHGGPERYPPTRRDDSIETEGERRSFDPSATAPTPRQGAGDGSVSSNEGRVGPGGDPAEGKR
jgi:hypothetical protein